MVPLVTKPDNNMGDELDIDESSLLSQSFVGSFEVESHEITPHTPLVIVPNAEFLNEISEETVVQNSGETSAIPSISAKPQSTGASSHIRGVQPAKPGKTPQSMQLTKKKPYMSE